MLYYGPNQDLDFYQVESTEAVSKDCAVCMSRPTVHSQTVLLQHFTVDQMVLCENQ